MDLRDLLSLFGLKRANAELESCVAALLSCRLLVSKVSSSMLGRFARSSVVSRIHGSCMHGLHEVFRLRFESFLCMIFRKMCVHVVDTSEWIGQNVLLCCFVVKAVAKSS